MKEKKSCVHRRARKRKTTILCDLANQIGFFSVTDNPSNARHHQRKKKKTAPQPPNPNSKEKRSIGLQTEDCNHDLYASINMKKTYLFATSSNEMAFPNNASSIISRRNEASNYQHEDCSDENLR